MAGRLRSTACACHSTEGIGQPVEAIEQELAELQRMPPMAKLLSTISDIGPITATTIAATVPDPTMFRSGREFAGRLGLTRK
ncbi:hypothetical protein AOQ73_27965 [Bradyrhizobium pachyrhizi]|nr:hypothetical protein AOQ73_27965 [Bradyrhizobium pachyrhizi]